MRGDALQTFNNITSPNRENLGESLTVFRRKYVKSMAAAKHKFQRLVFKPANQKLIDFLDELQKLVKYAFGVAAQAIIEQFIYGKTLPHLKKSINQVGPPALSDSVDVKPSFMPEVVEVKSACFQKHCQARSPSASSCYCEW